MNITLLYDNKTHELVTPEMTHVIAPQLALEIEQLNTLSKELIKHGKIPEPATPQSFNQDLSKAIRKLYESGVAAFKANRFEDASKNFTVGIEIINRRNKFESFEGTTQELSLFLMSRADSFLRSNQHLRALNDADMLLALNVTTPDNFLRRGVANFFLGNYEDARADYQRGLAFDENNERLDIELGICLDKILEENGDRI